MPRLTAPIVLTSLAIAALILDDRRRRKQRYHCREKRTALAATASWENEGGRITLS